MTTEATEASKIEAAQAAVAEAQAALDTARAEASAYATEIMALDTRTEEQEDKLADLTLARRRAATVLEQRTATLNDARASSVFESLLSVREPVRDAFRSLLIESTPTVSIVSAVGTVTIVKADDGTESAEVALTATLSKLDLEAIKTAIAESVDVAAFTKAGITSVSYTVSDIGTPSAMVDDKITAKGAASKPATPKASGDTDGATSRKAWSYQVNGEWIGAKAFLEHVEASGHAIATDRAQSFETSLRGTKNGLSTLAQQVAAKLNTPTRQGDGE